MGQAMRRLHSAINSHDIDKFVALFAHDYRSDQPAHPARRFEGDDKVRENWTAVFAGIPDITADLVLDVTTDQGIELGEWSWHGSHLDGSSFAMSGVIVLGVEDGLITWGRLYMEPVDQDSEDIDRMVQHTYRPPPASTAE